MSDTPTSSFIKIRNMRRRMVRLSLGDGQRKTVVVNVVTPARGKGGSGSMAITEGSRGRRRISVTQQLMIPSMTTIDKMPDGTKIPETIKHVPSIMAAVARGDIRIEE